MTRAGFSYAQARLHVRLSERLKDADWQYLETSRDLAHSLEVVSRTSAAGIVTGLDHNSNGHDIERALRNAWFADVAEIAGWLSKEWRGALEWMALLPHLRWPEYISGGGISPEWLELDPRYANYEDLSGDADISEVWQQGLMQRFPDKGELEAVSSALKPLFARYLVSVPDVKALDETGGSEQLIKYLKQQFRSRFQTPVAIFAYLGLASLDFERLRATLTLRALFPEPVTKVGG